MHIVLNVLPQSLCGWPRRSLHLLDQEQTHPIVRLAYLCHVIGKEFVFLSFVYIKMLELGVERASINRSALIHKKN